MTFRWTSRLPPSNSALCILALIHVRRWMMCLVSRNIFAEADAECRRPYLLGFLAKIKCSICSNQCENWFPTFVGLFHIHFWISRLTRVRRGGLRGTIQHKLQTMGAYTYPSRGQRYVINTLVLFYFRSIIVRFFAFLSSAPALHQRIPMRFWWPDWQPRERSLSSDSE
uniref:Uncharacterized protein n=1 Tax=Hyaloperonospora arabidopsidis (strain Emoy2) TaxID=559515 RepID=M4BIR9_HYAAE